MSTVEQNHDRQLEGIQLDKVFTDKASGRDKLRPSLDHLIDYVRDGDAVVVHSMDRLARNLEDLRSLVVLIPQVSPHKSAVLTRHRVLWWPSVSEYSGA